MGLKFRKTGGYDAVITDITFEHRGPYEGKNGEFYTRSATVEHLVDGAETPQVRFVPAGFVREGQSVSTDGRTLISANGETVLEENTEFSRLLQSAVENGFPEEKIPEDLSTFTSMIGSRVRFFNWVDEEATKKRGKRKGKDGKEYNITELRISNVYAVGDGKVRSTKGGKTTAPTLAKGAKTTTKPTTTTPDIDTTQADTVLVQLVNDYGKENALERYGISGAMVRYAIKNKLSEEVRDSLRGLLVDEEYLVGAQERGKIAYDPSKGNPKMRGVIEAAA